MNCSVKLKFTEDQEMLAVPSTSVIFDKSKTFIIVYRDRDDLETREVNVFRDINGVSYISDGLIQGEKIISRNSLFIYDAMND